MLNYGFVKDWFSCYVAIGLMYSFVSISLEYPDIHAHLNTPGYLMNHVISYVPHRVAYYVYPNVIYLSTQWEVRAISSFGVFISPRGHVGYSSCPEVALLFNSFHFVFFVPWWHNVYNQLIPIEHLWDDGYIACRNHRALIRRWLHRV